MMDIRDVAIEIRRVLEGAERIGDKRILLSAYQILDQLPGRDLLLSTCQQEQVGEAAFHLAASIVTRALLHHLSGEITVEMAGPLAASIKVGTTTIGSKHGPIAVFRLNDKSAVEPRF